LSGWRQLQPPSCCATQRCAWLHIQSSQSAATATTEACRPVWRGLQSSWGEILGITRAHLFIDDQDFDFDLEDDDSECCVVVVNFSNMFVIGDAFVSIKRINFINKSSETRIRWLKKMSSRLTQPLEIFCSISIFQKPLVEF
jgi:hypothetical protein